MYEPRLVAGTLPFQPRSIRGSTKEKLALFDAATDATDDAVAVVEASDGGSKVWAMGQVKG